MSPASHYAVVLGREIHYVAWGERHRPALFLWHGLARTGRDFDALAEVLAADFYVIAPDMIGRGLSEWSSVPQDEYSMHFYAGIAAGLADHLGIAHFDWVGTSMGGAIGIRAAGTILAARIRRLVLNDIGPEISPAAVERIKTYSGNPPAFSRVGELEVYLRTIYAPFESLRDEEWRRMTETSVRRLPDGQITLHYDPKIVGQFFNYPQDYEQWEHWDRLTLPVLCLRGSLSDLLLAPAAEAMTRRGPACRLVTIAGVGHAPALNVAQQIRIVREFLTED